MSLLNNNKLILALTLSPIFFVQYSKAMVEEEVRADAYLSVERATLLYSAAEEAENQNNTDTYYQSALIAEEAELKMKNYIALLLEAAKGKCYDIDNKINTIRLGSRNIREKQVRLKVTFDLINIDKLREEERKLSELSIFNIQKYSSRCIQCSRYIEHKDRALRAMFNISIEKELEAKIRLMVATKQEELHRATAEHNDLVSSGQFAGYDYRYCN